MKLLIADDEKIIRETIYKIIDWKKMGIQTIIQASNGIDAYNIILDENPDIVLTDIKMPGLSGLDLIEKSHEANLDTRFIIITGYSEFEYAKKAMKYGVTNYLLKPCNEKQIIQSVSSVMKEIEHDSAFYALRSENSKLINSYYNSMISAIISNGLSIDITNDKDALDELINTKINPFRKYVDLDNTPFEMLQFFFLPQDSLEKVMCILESIRKKTSPEITYHYIYVSASLTVFFRSYRSSYSELDQLIMNSSLNLRDRGFKFVRKSFQSMRKLMQNIIPSLNRYEKIFYSNESDILHINNQDNIRNKVISLVKALFSKDEDNYFRILDQVLNLMADCSNIGFLKELVQAAILTLSSSNAIFNIVPAYENVQTLNKYDDKDTIIDKAHSYFDSLRIQYYQANADNISSRICNYVNDNIADSQLSLKWISDHFLFMNVDYISKKFLKETGEKFSNYLGKVRIQKAKEYLLADKNMNTQQIAEHVGCGNNPQYLSQIFKKQTGMTISQYKKTLI